MRGRLVATAVGVGALLSSCGGGSAPPTDDPSAAALTLAVIGDTPYGDEQIAAFPALVDEVNRDRHVEIVLHLGDIQTGKSPCTNAYLKRARELFDSFADPFVYTPGDNEWTDCHLPRAGGHVPTDRLAALRRTLYPARGETLGRRTRRLRTQADEPGFGAYVENQSWTEAGVVFSTVHVVGSDNGLAPWFGNRETAAQSAERRAEYDARLEAALAWLDRTFATARSTDAAGVVVAWHADTFGDAPSQGFDAIVARLAERARAFDGPVLLLEGDSHTYLVDRPLGAGSPAHGVRTAARNVTRIVVQGATASEWLRLSVDPSDPDVFSWTRVQVAGAER